MKIENSSVAMSSNHSYAAVSVKQFASITSLKGQEVSFDSSKEGESLFKQLQDALKEQEKSDKTNDEQAKNAYKVMSRPVYNNQGMQTVSSVQELKIKLLEQMVAMLQRHQHEKNIDNESPISKMWNEQNMQSGYALSSSSYGNMVSVTGNYVTQTVMSSFVAEEETTAFTTQGKVTTADGREINFDVSFEMSRSFAQSMEVYSEQQFQLCDPLVVNFNGDVTQLGDQKFRFDLDADGEEEEISDFTSNSGFLALDKNNDGTINDGSELFGTKSGNGFKDLAEYDKDGNGWIDENDDIFDKLRIWTKDDEGNDKIMTLKEAGLGAIYLGSTDTKFSLNNTYDNSVNGVIQRSGVFLNENGTTGTIQHVDFAI